MKLVRTHNSIALDCWLEFVDLNIETYLQNIADVIIQQSKTLAESHSSIAAISLAIQQYTQDEMENFEAGMQIFFENVSNSSTEPQSPLDAQEDRREISPPPMESSSQYDLAGPSSYLQAYETDTESMSSSRLSKLLKNLDSECQHMMAEGSLFLCEGNHWGAASNAIRAGDVVVRMEMDPYTLYIFRPKEDQNFEVVSTAAVPSMVDLEEEIVEPMRSFFLI